MFVLPKEILQLQETLQRLAVSSKLPVANKEGYYLSSFFLSRFRIEYLDQLLSSWDVIDKSDFNLKLKNAIEENLEELQMTISSSLKNREDIVNGIFQLYNAKQYQGLIPLVLSQADGIMKEITRGKWGLYNSNHENEKNNPNKLKYSEADIYYNFLSSYEQLNVENRNEYELFAKGVLDPIKFNRHSILHGESTQFGSELNGIKSILLISFIAEIYSSNSNS